MTKTIAAIFLIVTHALLALADDWQAVAGIGAVNCEVIRNIVTDYGDEVVHITETREIHYGTVMYETYPECFMPKDESGIPNVTIRSNYRAANSCGFQTFDLKTSDLNAIVIMINLAEVEIGDVAHTLYDEPGKQITHENLMNDGEFLMYVYSPSASQRFRLEWIHKEQKAVVNFDYDLQTDKLFFSQTRL